MKRIFFAIAATGFSLVMPGDARGAILQSFDRLFVGDDPTEGFTFALPYNPIVPGELRFDGYAENLAVDETGVRFFLQWYRKDAGDGDAIAHPDGANFGGVRLPGADPVAGTVRVPIQFGTTVNYLPGGVWLTVEGLGPSDRFRLVGHLTIEPKPPPPLIDYRRVRYLPQPPAASEAEKLIEGRDGRFYGTLHSRANYGGALFRMEPDGSSYTVIYVSATNRPSGIIEGADGWLYGTMAGPPGPNATAVFRMDRDGGNLTMLRTFSSERAQFGVIQDGEGWLYGTTAGDGALNGGSVFKLNTNGTGFEELHRFGGLAQDDGLVPAALTLGRDGFLYGCTFYGGYPSNSGTVFKLGRSGSGYAVFHRFEGSAQGRYPAANRPLLEGSDGFLYGAADGGIHRAGVLFKLGKDGGNYQVIHQFAGENGTGDSPLGGLQEWCDGALYGATYEGGIDGAGMLFRVNKDGSGFAVLHIYIDAPNPGATEGTPRTPLLPASDGRLYGITSGGTVAEGTVYRISPRPTLQIRPASREVVLTWPACLEGYVLEESDELGPASVWRQVESAGEVIGAVRQVVWPTTGERRFFRLSRP